MHDLSASVVTAAAERPASPWLVEMPERLQCSEESAWSAGRAINEAGLAFRQSQAEVLSQASKPKEPTRLGLSSSGSYEQSLPATFTLMIDC